MGLDAYEYSCSRGIRLDEEAAKELGMEAWMYDIALSIHAPYYINPASQEKDKRDRSKKYILDSLQTARWMGATRVVFHLGACGKISRKLALDTAVKLFSECLVLAKQMDLGDVHLCPETMGKRNQLGTLDEVLSLCRLDESVIPTLDFGHMHALGLGSLKTRKDYETILNQVENELGYDRLKRVHIHFSRIEYTSAGEKKHRTLNETQYGPDFEPLAELIYKKSMSPVIICESQGTMAEDALKLRECYQSIQAM
jgi:deoxyribonuclease-4